VLRVCRPALHVLPAGAFVGPDGKSLMAESSAVPNTHMRLFGGAQFHRCGCCLLRSC
jgi:hypothetical protein